MARPSSKHPPASFDTNRRVCPTTRPGAKIPTATAETPPGNFEKVCVLIMVIARNLCGFLSNGTVLREDLRAKRKTGGSSRTAETGEMTEPPGAWAESPGAWTVPRARVL